MSYIPISLTFDRNACLRFISVMCSTASIQIITCGLSKQNPRVVVHISTYHVLNCHGILLVESSVASLTIVENQWELSLAKSTITMRSFIFVPCPALIAMILLIELNRPCVLFAHDLLVNPCRPASHAVGRQGQRWVLQASKLQAGKNHPTS